MSIRRRAWPAIALVGLLAVGSIGYVLNQTRPTANGIATCDLQTKPVASTEGTLVAPFVVDKEIVTLGDKLNLSVNLPTNTDINYLYFEPFELFGDPSGSQFSGLISGVTDDGVKVTTTIGDISPTEFHSERQGLDINPELRWLNLWEGDGFPNRQPISAGTYRIAYTIAGGTPGWHAVSFSAKNNTADVASTKYFCIQPTSTTTETPATTPPTPPIATCDHISISLSDGTTHTCDTPPTPPIVTCHLRSVSLSDGSVHSCDTTTPPAPPPTVSCHHVAINIETGAVLTCDPNQPITPTPAPVGTTTTTPPAPPSATTTSGDSSTTSGSGTTTTVAPPTQSTLEIAKSALTTTTTTSSTTNSSTSSSTTDNPEPTVKAGAPIVVKLKNTQPTKPVTISINDNPITTVTPTKTNLDVPITIPANTPGGAIAVTVHADNWDADLNFPIQVAGAKAGISNENRNKIVTIIVFFALTAIGLLYIFFGGRKKSDGNQPPVTPPMVPPSSPTV